MASFMDKLKNKAQQTVKEAVKETVQNAGNKTEKIVFPKLPDDLTEFKALPQADMSTPFETAAMTVVALTYYSFNKTLCLDMLNYLRGPRPLSEMEKQFIADRFRDKDYVPRSYYEGATPENNYEPTEPYTITVSENPYSYQNENYATLYIRSGGADSPRQVQMRLAKDGKWYLWDQMLLADIRVPAEQDPWA